MRFLRTHNISKGFLETVLYGHASNIYTLTRSPYVPVEFSFDTDIESLDKSKFPVATAASQTYIPTVRAIAVDAAKESIRIPLEAAPWDGKFSRILFVRVDVHQENYVSIRSASAKFFNRLTGENAHEIWLRPRARLVVQLMDQEKIQILTGMSGGFKWTRL